MQKNTKILLGLGLIGLAYYLWQKSSKLKGLPSVIKPIDRELEWECDKEYSMMPRPTVVKPPEYWEKRRNEYIKNCLIRKKSLAEKGLNEKCSDYAGSQLAAMRFISAAAYDEAWKGEYDKCMAGKMENQENPLLLKIREKRAKELSNEWCEIISKAYSQGRELNKEEETRANQIGKQVEQLGYTGVGFSIISGVPNCNQLITIEESNKYPRF